MVNKLFEIKIGENFFGISNSYVCKNQYKLKRVKHNLFHK